MSDDNDEDEGIRFFKGAGCVVLVTVLVIIIILLAFTHYLDFLIRR